MKIIIAVLGVLMLSSCMKNNVEIYSKNHPQMDVKQFFNGKLKAWGIVQNWRGEVVNKFDVVMNGTWQGDTGKLEEDFNYYNGKTQKRIWTLKKISDSEIEGTASDIVGKAIGKTSGDALNFNYIMDIDVEGKTYRVKLDDWMWKMNDDVIINRSYIKKFGFTVAELTIFMQKQ